MSETRDSELEGKRLFEALKERFMPEITEKIAEIFDDLNNDEEFTIVRMRDDLYAHIYWADPLDPDKHIEHSGGIPYIYASIGESANEILPAGMSGNTDGAECTSVTMPFLDFFANMDAETYYYADNIKLYDACISILQKKKDEEQRLLDSHIEHENRKAEKGE